MWRVALAVLLSLGTVGCPAPAAPLPPSTLTPQAVVTAAKATIEQWRQAQEIRSLETLAKLYARDLDLVVVQDGTSYLGWTDVEAMLTDRFRNHRELHFRLKNISIVSQAPGVATAIATLSRELVAQAGAITLTDTGTLTLVLKQQGGTWVIVSEHYSIKRPT